MKTNDNIESIDWRERLHSLPSGTEPASPFFIVVFRVFVAFGIFLIGAFLTIVFGYFAGLSLGVGPEQTGGTLYVFLGLIINIVIGAALSAFIARRSSRALARVVFYSYTAPAFLIVLFLAYSFLTYYFQ